MTHIQSLTPSGSDVPLTPTAADGAFAVAQVGQQGVSEILLVLFVLTLVAVAAPSAVRFVHDRRPRSGQPGERDRRAAEQTRDRAESTLERLDRLVDGEPDPGKWAIPRRKLRASDEAMVANEYAKARQHARGVTRAARRNAENAVERAKLTVEDPSPGADRERATDRLDAARIALEADRYAEAWVRARDAVEAADPDPNQLIEAAETAAEAAASLETETDESPAAAERCAAKRRESRDAYARALEIAEAGDKDGAAERLREELESAEAAFREAEKRSAVERIRESTERAARTADRGSTLREDGEYRDAADAFASATEQYEQALSVAREHDLSSSVDRIETGLEWTRGRAVLSRLDAAEASIDDASERLSRDPEAVSEEMSTLMSRLEDREYFGDRDDRIAALRREAARVRLAADTDRLEATIEGAESHAAADRDDTAADRYESTLSAAEKGLEVTEEWGFDEEQERLGRLAELCRMRIGELRE